MLYHCSLKYYIIRYYLKHYKNIYITVIFMINRKEKEYWILNVIWNGVVNAFKTNILLLSYTIEWLWGALFYYHRNYYLITCKYLFIKFLTYYYLTKYINILSISNRFIILNYRNKAIQKIILLFLYVIIAISIILFILNFSSLSCNNLFFHNIKMNVISISHSS